MNAADPAASLDDSATHTAFLAAMQTPAAYAALQVVDGPIRCIETHISWVFLTGRYAYKVKKPLKLRFLDYSSAVRREACCHEELRLNRRQAPDLYVDVVPIAGRPDAPRVGDVSAPAFEHALRMVEFDPREELSKLLDGGAVGPADLATFGAALAEAHDQATVAAPGNSYGAARSVHAITSDNFTEIARALCGDPQVSNRLRDLQAALEQWFTTHRDNIDARKRDGFVRECHADLHCGNVVRWRGRLVGFDALEFDPALRFIDVASDLAFLAMDLAVRGRPDLRRALLDAWTAASGDYAATALLPYYESYRALVRAKVACLRAEQHLPDLPDARAEAQRYVEWARQRVEARAPVLVVMVGLSGSGKTWMARRIAERLDASLVRSDVERKRLAGLGPLESSRSAPDAGIYSREFNTRTYERLCDCARDCLRGAMNVVVDAASLRRAERAAFVQLAAQCGARVRLVHCHASLALRRERVAAREQARSDASEATVDLLERQAGYWEPLSDDEAALALDVDTSRPGSVERLLETLLD